jgi:FAD dependent oxidoreductase TIGR03364
MTPAARPRAVIVGGGILGTWHAVHAVQAGFSVTHLEGDAGPRRASVRNFGLVWVSGRAAGAELALAQRARDLWQEVAERHLSVTFRASGSLTVATSDAELAVLAQAAQLADAGEREFEILDAAEIRRRNPALRGDVVGALWCGRDAIVEPGRVLSELREAIGAGYSFVVGRRVVEVGRSFAVDHLGNRHDADVVIVCAGAEHDGPVGAVVADAALRRCRLQMMETAPLDAAVSTAVADIDSLRYYPAFSSLPLDALDPQPAVAAAHHMQLLLVQRADGRLTIGDTHAYDEPFDVGVVEGPYRHLVARAEQLLGRRLPEIERRWSGVYSQVTDDALYRRVTTDDGVIVVTGAGGRGMTCSPAIAEATVAALA